MHAGVVQESGARVCKSTPASCAEVGELSHLLLNRPAALQHLGLLFADVLDGLLKHLEVAFAHAAVDQLAMDRQDSVLQAQPPSVHNPSPPPKKFSPSFPTQTETGLVCVAMRSTKGHPGERFIHLRESSVGEDLSNSILPLLG